MAFLKTHDLTLKRVVLTHGHYDHIAGLNKILEYIPNIKVFIGEEEKEFLSEGSLSLSMALNGTLFKYNGDFTTVKEGDEVAGFKVIDTPGHTRGSKCYYHDKEKIIFSGDTMFRRSYGRFDLPTSSREALFDSLKKLCTYPLETRVYSGHTEVTTIEEEKSFLTREKLI